MTLLTAHRILISTAVVFFCGFAFWEVQNYLTGQDGRALLRGLVYLVVSVGFGIYLWSLRRWLK